MCIQGETAIPPRAGKYQFSLFGVGGIAIELYNRCQSAVYRVGATTEEVDRAGDEAIYYQARAFVTQVRDGAPPACSVWDGLLANLLLEACFRAHRTHEPQRIVWRDDRPLLAG